MGGTPTFGYTNEKKEWAINKEEGEWVKFIFNQIIKGKSVKDIKTHLDLSGVKPRRTRNGLWNLVTLQKMLRNESYTGLKRWKLTDKETEKVLGNYAYQIPQIISQTQFRKVQKIMDARMKHKDNNKKHFTVLDDLLYCECGTRMGSKIKKGKTSKGYAFETKMYYCISREKLWKGEIENSNCTNHRSMHIDKTTDAVISLVKETVANSHQLKDKFKKEVLTKKFENDQKIKEDRKKLESKTKLIQRNIQTTVENISRMEVEKIQGRKDERVATTIIKHLKDELELLEKDYSQNNQDIDDLDSRKEWLDWVGKFGEELELKTSNPKPQRELFCLHLFNLCSHHPTPAPINDKISFKSDLSP